MSCILWLARRCCCWLAWRGSCVAGTFAYPEFRTLRAPHRRVSVPDVDPTTQLGYATNAIREGGLFGVGVGEGQVKWSLPDAHTDFIIAVAAEEYGLILVLVIILLYGGIVVRSLLRLVRERDPFIRLAGTGLACTFGVQAMINMGVAVRLLPAKGMTLPFVSYGGSSVIAGGIACGMLLAFTRTRPQGEIARSASERKADEQTAASCHRRGRHRRAYVSGPGAGRGDAGTRLAGHAEHRRARRALHRRLSRRGDGNQSQQRHLRARRADRQSARAVTHCAGRLRRMRSCARPAHRCCRVWRLSLDSGHGCGTWLRIPRMIHEQNGVLGRVNRAVRHTREHVACGTWPTDLPRGIDGIHTGNPVRAAILERAGRRLHATGRYPMELLVMGGSQGARILSTLCRPPLRTCR